MLTPSKESGVQCLAIDVKRAAKVKIATTNLIVPSNIFKANKTMPKLPLNDLTVKSTPPIFLIFW